MAILDYDLTSCWMNMIYVSTRSQMNLQDARIAIIESNCQERLPWTSGESSNAVDL